MYHTVPQNTKIFYDSQLQAIEEPYKIAGITVIHDYVNTTIKFQFDPVWLNYIIYILYDMKHQTFFNEKQNFISFYGFIILDLEDLKKIFEQLFSELDIIEVTLYGSKDQLIFDTLVAECHITLYNK